MGRNEVFQKGRNDFGSSIAITWSDRGFLPFGKNVLLPPVTSVIICFRSGQKSVSSVKQRLSNLVFDAVSPDQGLFHRAPPLSTTLSMEDFSASFTVSMAASDEKPNAEQILRMLMLDEGLLWYEFTLFVRIPPSLYLWVP